MIIKKSILNFINSKVSKEFDPFYVYDSQEIREHCRKFMSICYENKDIHFATMANINPHFLSIVREEKIKVFVNSILHLQAVMDVGYHEKDIIFTSSGLTEKKMILAQKFGIQVNLDSPSQLELWQMLFPDKPVGIRCNIGDNVKPFSTHAGFFIGKESRLGFTLDEMSLIQDKSLIKGLHLYVGTDIFDVDYFIDCYKELIKTAGNFPKLEYLNFGGGFGVSENAEKSFDIGIFNEKVTQLMKEFSEKQGKSIKLILEPGRIIGCEAGFFVCHVSDVKKRGDSRLVGVNASTVQFSRPLLYPDIARHPVAVVRDGVQYYAGDTFETTIFGCSTYSRDIFSRKVQLPDLKIGDVVVFGNAGSYSASSHSQFLGFEKSEEYFI